MTDSTDTGWKTAVVIPSFKVKRYIGHVLSGIPACVERIYVVDDACPEHTGRFVEDSINDPRIRVIYHKANQGVGGAVITGYNAAIEDGTDIIVKIDGDGQMDTRLIPHFIEPIMSGTADYTKGNRFHNLEDLKKMPGIRLFGNAVLSLITKLSSGYWDIFDPTNGYTAIHSDVAKHLPLDKISKDYFFESDILFRLNILRAVVVDIPIYGKYGDEISNLRISRIVTMFLFRHTRNLSKRIFYNYYLRDMSIASIELPLGVVMLTFGILFGGSHWYSSTQAGTLTSAGTVMLAALPALMGLQFILAFLGHDITSVPKKTIHPSHSRLK